MIILYIVGLVLIIYFDSLVLIVQLVLLRYDHSKCFDHNK